MANRTMKVRRIPAPPHYEFATSFEIIGPTSDGLLHMHFFREGMLVHGETGDVVAQSERRVELRNLRQAEGSPEHVRVEVAVISFPAGKLAVHEEFPDQVAKAIQDFLSSLGRVHGATPQP